MDKPKSNLNFLQKVKKETKSLLGAQHLLTRFLFFFVSLLYLEVFLHWMLYNSLAFDQNFFLMCFFTLCYALVAVFLCGPFGKRINLTIAIILQFVVSVIFCAQFVYFQFFKTPFLFYSFLRAGQVTEFADDVLTVIGANWLVLFAFFSATHRACRMGQEIPRTDQNQSMWFDRCHSCSALFNLCKHPTDHRDRAAFSL